MSRIGVASMLALALLAGGAGLAARAALAAGPDFSLAASPPSVDLPAGGSQTTAVTVTPSGGFSGAVTLSVAGLPAGVTSRLVPVSGTTTDLVLSASSSVATTFTRITVTGTGGALSHSLAIPLTVAGFVSDYAILPNPSSLTVAAGSSATSTITGTPASGTPAFSVAGLPAGVTATFGTPGIAPNGASTTTMTVTAGPTATATSTRFLVSATAGSARASAGISLTVTATPR